MKSIKLIFTALAILVMLTPFALPVTAAEHGVHWLTIEQGREKQRELKKPMLLFFHLPYCYRCKEMERKVYADPKVANNINQNFIPVMLDMDKEKVEVERFNVDYTPTNIFVAPDGSTVVLRKEGIIRKSSFEEMLEYVAKEKYRTMNFDAYEKHRP